MAVTYVMGDVHGHYDKLVTLLQGHHLIGADLSWTGEDTTLCFLGDYVDRGSRSIDVIDLVMRLQREAGLHNGRVIALPGNHEAFLLSAIRFGSQRDILSGETFRLQWVWNGGDVADLHRIQQAHIDWLANLPAMVRLGDYLLIHADSPFYLKYGDSIDSVNRAMRAVFTGNNIGGEMSMLIDGFCRRGYFTDRPFGGTERARQFLSVFGGKFIVHGHTPIPYMADIEADQVHEPYIYADGVCIDLDPALYQGGNGFLFELPSKAV